MVFCDEHGGDREAKGFATEPTRADWPSALMRRARAGPAEGWNSRERNNWSCFSCD